MTDGFDLIDPNICPAVLHVNADFRIDELHLFAGTGGHEQSAEGKGRKEAFHARIFSTRTFLLPSPVDN